MARPSSRAIHLVERFVRRVESEEAILDLMPAQWAILRFLVRGAPDRSLVEIANFTGLEIYLCANVVAALKRKRLVESWPGSSTATTRIKITTTGKAKLAKDPVMRLEVVLGELLSEEEAALYALLDRAIERTSVSRQSPF